MSLGGGSCGGSWFCVPAHVCARECICVTRYPADIAERCICARMSAQGGDGFLIRGLQVQVLPRLPLIR